MFGVSALERGASCACGVLNEPYLTGHQRPNILIYYLLQGYSFAEAAALATPTLGWQDVNIGDPLYAPFRAKTAVLDITAPVLEAGSPLVLADGTAGERTVLATLDVSQSPEVAQLSVDYGTTPAYGSTIAPGQGFWRRSSATLIGLADGTTYHYRLHLVDPVGNTTTTGDYQFTTNAAAASPPTLASPASAPGTVTTASCPVSVLGADGAGEANLTYTWAAIGTPPAPIAVSVNGLHAAQQATITFQAPGTYDLEATIVNQDGLSVTSLVVVQVVATLSAVSVQPSSCTVATQGTQSFSASGADQFGSPFLLGGTSWGVSGGGSISSAGLFSAGSAAGGPFTVTATSGSQSGTASLTVSTLGTGSGSASASGSGGSSTAGLTGGGSSGGGSSGCGVGGGVGLLLALAMLRRRRPE